MIWYETHTLSTFLKENSSLDLRAFEIFIEPKVVATNNSNIIFEENNVEEVILSEVQNNPLPIAAAHHRQTLQQFRIARKQDTVRADIGRYHLSTYYCNLAFFK